MIRVMTIPPYQDRLKANNPLTGLANMVIWLHDM